MFLTSMISADEATFQLPTQRVVFLSGGQRNRF